MKFGKREQIVVVSLLGLGTIGLLQLMVFSPRAAKFKESFDKYEKAANDLNGLAGPRHENDIPALNKSTDALKTQYDEVLTSLGLTRPAAFDLPMSAAEVKPEDLTPPPPPKAQPAEINKLKDAALPGVRAAKKREQVQMVLAEIKKLRQFDARVGGTAAEKTKIYFLAGKTEDGGWALPIKLPDTARGGVLDDLLNNIDQTVNIMKAIEKPELMQQQRQTYEQYLAGIGVDNAIYRNFAPTVVRPNGTTFGGLASRGEYVPIIHKMVHAMLLEDAILESLRAGIQDEKKKQEVKLEQKLVSGKPVTRERIFEWLELQLPLEPIKNMRDSEMYFLYLQLHYLNELLAMMVSHKVTEIYSVLLEDVGYLREGITVLPPDEPGKDKEKDLAPKGLRENYFAVAPPPGRPAAAPALINMPKADDLGYVVPIVVQFRAQNLSAWKFVYDVLRRYPLAEFDQADFRAAPPGPGGEGGDIICEARFIFVPTVFKVTYADRGGTPAMAQAAAAKPAPRPPPPQPAPQPASQPASKLPGD